MRVRAHVVKLLEADALWDPLSRTTVACDEDAMAIYALALAGIIGGYDNAVVIAEAEMLNGLPEFAVVGQASSAVLPFVGGADGGEGGDDGWEE